MRARNLAPHLLDTNHIDILRHIAQILMAVGGSQCQCRTLKLIRDGRQDIRQLNASRPALDLAQTGAFGCAERNLGNARAVYQV